ncbi:glycosyl hydrolase 115 family protein [Fibrisoma limi]|nr:glycosyl hydrolase 115 family protein [Fibrisoma limi]
MKNPVTYYLLISLLLLGGAEGWCQKPSPFVLVGARQTATVVVGSGEPECVRLAVQDLIGDVQKITDQQIRVTASTPGRSYQNAVIIGTVGRSSVVTQHLPESRQLTGKWENYRVQSVGSNLVLAGSDERGTMFAVYHFIEQYLGVDPLYFWSDREPAKRTALSWDTVSITQSTPTFRFRGWFINDEDLLTEWQRPGEPAAGGKRNIDYPFYGQVVAPQTLRHVVESLVRLRQNLIIPASFIDIRNPAEAALVQEAARRGVFVSMHHVEPMGVSAFTFFNYWREKAGLPLNGKGGNDVPLFSYFSSRPQLEEVWRVYATEWAKYPNVIWQIGLRGIADRPMWLADPGIPQTDADRGRLISEAMQTQMQLIRQVDKRPNPPITTTLWAEGSVLNKAGHLKIPEGVTVVFSDNSPGWRMQADFRDTPRQPGHSYGVYYHHQLWGSGPHLTQIVPPAQTYKVLREVYEKGDTAYAIANISNLREFVLGADATARMLTGFSNFRIDVFERNWFTARYGASAAQVQQAYQTYFDGFALNSRTQTPILMDGQLRSIALGQLRELRLQLTDSAGYAVHLKQQKVETEESRWIKSALADMGSENLDTQTLLKRVQAQKTAHLRADSLAQLVLPQLPVSERRFMETNLLANLDLILGLETWLEGVLQARIAANANRLSDVETNLQHAVAAFDQMQKGQHRIATGKWQNWYQGDKKMNLEECRRVTETIRNKALSERPGSRAVNKRKSG